MNTVYIDVWDSVSGCEIHYVKAPAYPFPLLSRTTSSRVKEQLFLPTYT
jgi:hypothetical protein